MTVPTVGGWTDAAGIGNTVEATIDPTANVASGGVQVGDWIICVMQSGGPASSSRMPSMTGWTTIRAYGDMNASATSCFGVYARKRLAGDTTYAITQTTAEANSSWARMIFVRGAADIASWIVGAFTPRAINATTTTAVANSVTTTVGDSLGLALAGERTIATETEAQVSVSNFTKLFMRSAENGSGDTSLTAATKSLTTAGATGAVTFTYPNTHAQNGIAGVIAITPAPTGQPVAAYTSTVTGLSVAFDASASSDPAGTITKYAWDFGDGGTASGAGATQKIMVPAYFYPDGARLADWTKMNTAAPTMEWIIVNPNSGPGTVVDPNYTTVINNARAAGIKLLGYVRTDYAATPGHNTRTLAACKADVDRYWSLYGAMDGIFFDEQSSRTADITFYADLYDYVKTKGATKQVMTNPGLPNFAEEYMYTPSTTPSGRQTNDFVMNFEDTAAQYLSASPLNPFPAWVTKYPRERFYHGILGPITDTTQFNAVLAKTRTHNAKYFYITEQILATDPWDMLAAEPYWTNQVNYFATDLIGRTVTHNYNVFGSYIVMLTVTNSTGATDTEIKTLSVGTASPWSHMTVWDGISERPVVNAALWDGVTEKTVVSVEAYVEASATITAGALLLGQASYPVPAGSIHVYPGDSVQTALNVVPSGGTVVLHDGVHRISTMLQTTKSCIIQNAPGEAAWLDGSKVVTGWTNNGNGTWSAPYACKNRIDVSGTLWGSKDNPAAVIPDQCWIDGIRQWTIGDGLVPASGQVSFNKATSKITVFGDPTSKTVEASAAEAILLQMYPTTMRGFGVRRSSPAAVEWGGGGIYTASERQISGSVYENLHFTEHGNYALYISGAENVTVSDNTFTDCGMSGLGIGPTTAVPSGAKTGTVERNVFKRINFKKWNAEPTTACIKTVRANKMVIRNNHFTDFYFCAAIWYDISCIRTQVVGNYIDGRVVPGGLNRAGLIGIEVELSDGGGSGVTQERSLLAGNTIIGCETSFRVLCTAHHDVVNNTFDGGFTGGIGGGVYIQQDDRMGNGTDPANRPDDATWQTKYNRFYNNRIGAGMRQWFITGRQSLHNFSGMDYFDTGTSIAGNWAEPTGGGSNAFCSIQNKSDGYSSPTTWAAWKSNTNIGDTSKIGSNGQGTWDEAAALVYAVPLEAAWATALGKPVGWKGVGNPLPEPFIA